MLKLILRENIREFFLCLTKKIGRSFRFVLYVSGSQTVRRTSLGSHEDLTGMVWIFLAIIEK